MDRPRTKSCLPHDSFTRPHSAVTSAQIGASKVTQIEENLGALQHLIFAPDEIAALDRILAD